MSNSLIEDYGDAIYVNNDERVGVSETEWLEIKILGHDVGFHACCSDTVWVTCDTAEKFLELALKKVREAKYKQGEGNE